MISGVLEQLCTGHSGMSSLLLYVNVLYLITARTHCVQLIFFDLHLYIYIKLCTLEDT